MKKLVLVLTIMMIIVVASAKIDKLTGRLALDGNNKAIQSGISWRMYDDDQEALEHLDENTFATHANWDVTNDLDDDSLSVRWTWVDAVASTLTQVNADQALAVRNAQDLLLTYTIYDSTAIAGGTVDCWITGICDSLDMNITAGVGKTLAITTVAAASTADFVIHVQADASVTAGKFAFDDLYLTSYYESPISIATGSEVTITIPDNAVELIIDSRGIEIKREIGSAYFVIDTGHPIGCSGETDMTIANDSGETVTLYFYFNMAVEQEE